MSKASKQDIAKLIKSTEEEIADFERSIKTAPREERGNYKVFVRQQKAKLRKLKDIFESGDYNIEIQ